MARKDFPSSKQDQFVLRLPDGMRDQIKAIAEQNGRSMNAEIVARLDESLSGVTLRLDRENERLAERLERIEHNLQRMMKTVSREVDRQRAVRTDPERRSPEFYALREGRNDFLANPEGLYNNPYNRDDVRHLAYQNGFWNAARRHFSSDEEFAQRFPSLWEDRRPWESK